MWIINKFPGSTPVRCPSAVNPDENSYTSYALSVSLISQHLVCRISQTQMYRLTHSVRAYKMIFAVFTARQHSLLIAMQSAALAIVNPSVRPCVCPSVTCWHCVRMTQATIMRSSPYDSPMTLVSYWLTSTRNSKGNLGSEGAEWEG